MTFPIQTEEFELTFWEYFKATRISLRRARIFYFILNGAFLLQLPALILPDVDYLGDRHKELLQTLGVWIIFNAVIWAILILLTYISIPKSGKRIRHVLIEENFFTTYLKNGTIVKKNISGFVKVVKTNTMYLMMLNASIGIPVTYRAFKNEEDLSNFDNLLKERGLLKK